MVIEMFVVLIYDRTNQFCRVNSATQHLSSRKSCCLKNILTSQAALVQHKCCLSGRTYSGASNTEGPIAPISCKVGSGKKQRFHMEDLFGKIWHRLRKCVMILMNSFTVSVENMQGPCSVNVTKLISIALFFVNVEDTVRKNKKVKCLNYAYLL